MLHNIYFIILKMGFLSYLIYKAITFNGVDIEEPTFQKKMFYNLIDGINITYVPVKKGVEDANSEEYDETIEEEFILIEITINIYESYEDRLKRKNCIDTKMFLIDHLITKDFSDNLWNVCYEKVKELITTEYTDNIKEGLNLSEDDSIPSELNYLLTIEDHLN